MSGTAVKIKDKATPLIRRIRETVKGSRLQVVIGAAVRDLWSDHLIDKDRSEPNKLGGRRTHYYGKAADSVSFKAVTDGVIVSVSQVGLRQRLLGGTITPKRAKLLTIPVHPDAHGKRAGEFNDLSFIKTGSGRGATAVLAKTGQGSLFEVFYVLVKSVTQEGDPTVLPEEREISTTAERAATRLIKRITSRA